MAVGVLCLEKNVPVVFRAQTLKRYKDDNDDGTLIYSQVENILWGSLQFGYLSWAYYHWRIEDNGLNIIIGSFKCSTRVTLLTFPLFCFIVLYLGFIVFKAISPVWVWGFEKVIPYIFFDFDVKSLWHNVCRFEFHFMGIVPFFRVLLKALFHPTPNILGVFYLFILV